MVKSSEKTPKAPSADKAAEPSESVDAAVTPTTAPPEKKPLDPKEIARQRSKADLERKRHGGKNPFSKI